MKNDDGPGGHTFQHVIHDNLDPRPRRIARMDVADHRLVAELPDQAKGRSGEPSHGRPEESRSNACRFLDCLSSPFDFTAQKRCGKEVDRHVGESMISNFVTAGRDLAGKVGKCVDAPADQKERRFHPRPIEMTEQLGSMPRIRAIIERQRDTRLAGVDRAQEMPIQVRPDTGVVEETSRHEEDPSMDASGGCFPARNSRYSFRNRSIS